MHDGIDNITRRTLVASLLAAALAVALPASAAHAGDSGSDGGGGGSGGDHNGGDGHDGNSNGGDGHDSNSNGGDNGGDNGSSSSSNGNDHALNAVQSGAAAPLKDILAVVKKNYAGDVVRVKLTNQGKNLVYNIRILGLDNQLRDIFVDAKSRQIISPGIY